MTIVQRGDPEPVWQLGAALLEGPVWCPRDAALWFVDIKGRALHRLDPALDVRRSWKAPEQIGFVAPLAEGGFVAGLQSGLARFDPHDGSFVPLIDPEPDLPGNRLNDATVDASGRLWFGTMDDSEENATGRIYRYDGSDMVAVTAPVAITNGPAISPDGRTLYHVDTLGGVIHACDLTGDGGIANARPFVRIDPADGYPDGPTCDAEGCVWIGLYGGWAVRRYSPGGELIETIRFPVSAVTKIAFGGADLRTLYATTARKHVHAGALEREPAAGDLFAVAVDVPGIEGDEVRVAG